MAKHTLEKDLMKVDRLEEATHGLSRAIAAPGLAVLFLVGVLVLATGMFADGPLGFYVVIAAVVAGYMALNVGANDVANNMGPAVGGKALTMGSALVIAAICEAAGALIAGGDVVETISREVLRPDPSMGAVDFILVMMSGFLAAAMWIHLATFLNAPVSTTHAVIGGVVGAGLAASGPGMVIWPTMGAIAASWVISPLFGGLFAALLLFAVKTAILDKADKVAAARRWVPVLIALMGGTFAAYLVMKGLGNIWNPPFAVLIAIGIAGALAGWALSRPWVAARSVGLENRPKHIATLFTVPLIFAAALLSFAHGANDVANAVGPLAAIVSAAATGLAAPENVVLPIWVLVIGALGISIGLALFGPRLIRTVGDQITKMNTIRAYCVALSAAITVLVASALGMPVSSTHITVGAIFGVGFLREYIQNQGIPNPAIRPNTRFLKISALNRTPEQAVERDRKRERRRLVRRRYVWGIAAAWVITVPAAALVAALLYAGMSTVIGG